MFFLEINPPAERCNGGLVASIAISDLQKGQTFVVGASSAGAAGRFSFTSTFSAAKMTIATIRKSSTCVRKEPYAMVALPPAHLQGRHNDCHPKADKAG